MSGQVAIHEWVFADGKAFGCGSALELSYWQKEGIVDPDAKLGRVISYEPQSEDERRRKMWGLAEWHDMAPA